MGNLSKTELVGSTQFKKGRMTLALLSLAFCLVGSVEAQMYKCTGADGKTSFSDRPCITPGAKQETRAATLSDNARRIGISERSLRQIVDACQQGDVSGCQQIEDIRTPARDVSNAELARRWNEDVEMIEVAQKDCKSGNEWKCMRLARMKRTTPDGEKKEQQEMATKMCASGQKRACK